MNPPMLVATGDGAAAGVLAGLDGFRIPGDLVQRLALEAVEHPAALTAVADQPRVLEHLDMEGEPGLSDAEHLLQLAHATLFVRQHFDDLDAGFIGECVEPGGDPRGFGTSGGCHALNVSSFLDTSRPLRAIQSRWRRVMHTNLYGHINNHGYVTATQMSRPRAGRAERTQRPEGAPGALGDRSPALSDPPHSAPARRFLAACGAC